MKDPNAAVLAALGITDTNLTSVDLHLRPGELPSLRIERVVMEVPAPRYNLIWLQLDADNIDEPPFDLDAVCEAAMANVNATIDRLAAGHLRQMKLSAGLDAFAIALGAFEVGAA